MLRWFRFTPTKTTTANSLTNFLKTDRNSSTDHHIGYRIRIRFRRKSRRLQATSRSVTEAPRSLSRCRKTNRKKEKKSSGVEIMKVVKERGGRRRHLASARIYMIRIWIWRRILRRCRNTITKIWWIGTSTIASFIQKTSNSLLRPLNNMPSKWKRSSSRIGTTRSCLICQQMWSRRPRALVRSTIHCLDSWIIWSHPTTTSNSNTRTSRKTWTITARHETWRYRGRSRSCRIAWGAPPTTVSTKSECIKASWWWSKWRQLNRHLGNRRLRVQVAKTTESVLQILRTRNRSGRSGRRIIIVL